MMWGSGEGMGWWMVVGSAWFVLFWAIVIWAVVRLSSRETGSGSGQTATEVAQLRYARGEITKEEFEEIRRNLAA
jgi:putative membrane protein